MSEGNERLPYKPPEGKRFEVSKDPYTQERLVVLREGYLKKVFWEKINSKAQGLEHPLPEAHAFFYSLPVGSWRNNQKEFRNFIAAG